MTEQLITIILTNGEHIRKPMPMGMAREIEDYMRYGVFTEIGTTKVWYPPSQIVKIEYPDV